VNIKLESVLYLEYIVAYIPVARQGPRNKRDNSRCYANVRETRVCNRVTLGNGITQPVARQLQQLYYSNLNGGVSYVVHAEELS
jgi:hypothetical protein